MASFNRVILVGNLTRDPELRYIPSGMAVTEVGLAVNHRRKAQNGEWIEETTFVDVTLWGRTAEVASEYLSKGAPVLIEGRLKLDSWEKEGKKFSKLRVVGEHMQMLGAKGQGGGGGGGVLALLSPPELADVLSSKAPRTKTPISRHPKVIFPKVSPATTSRFDRKTANTQTHLLKCLELPQNELPPPIGFPAPLMVRSNYC